MNSLNTMIHNKISVYNKINNVRIMSGNFVYHYIRIFLLCFYFYYSFYRLKEFHYLIEKYSLRKKIEKSEEKYTNI